MDHLLDLMRYGMLHEAEKEGGSGGEAATAKKKAEQTGMDIKEGEGEDEGGEAPSSKESPKTGKDLEDLTDEWYEEGGEPEPESGPEKGDQSDEGESEGEKQEEPEPEGEDEGEDEGEQPDQKEGEKEKEGEGEAPETDKFYDPDVHAEGEPPHSNSYNNREDAVIAASNKLKMIKEDLEDLREDGIDTGAIAPPSYIDDEDVKGRDDIIQRAEQAMDPETINDMSDDELRQLLEQADRFRNKAKNWAKKKRGQKKAQSAKKELKDIQQDMVQDLADLEVTEEDIKENLSRIDQKDTGKEWLETKIEEKAKAEVADDVEALEEWIDSDEAERMDRREFIKERDRRREQINNKMERVMDQYSDLIENYDRAFDIAEQINEVADETGVDTMSAEEKQQNAREALDNWKMQMEGEHDVLQDTPEAKETLGSFTIWAWKREDQFNNLQHERDWERAFHKFNEFRKNLRADREKDKVSGDKKGSGEGSDDDFPEAREDQQEKIRTTEAEDVHDANKKRLDRLEEMTDNL